MINIGILILLFFILAALIFIEIGNEKALTRMAGLEKLCNVIITKENELIKIVEDYQESNIHLINKASEESTGYYD